MARGGWNDMKPTLIPWIHNRVDNPGVRCAERWVPSEGPCPVCGHINFPDPAETAIRELIRMNKERSR